jgi:hypothetical protein
VDEAVEAVMTEEGDGDDNMSESQVTEAEVEEEIEEVIEEAEDDDDNNDEEMEDEGDETYRMRDKGEGQGRVQIIREVVDRTMLAEVSGGE